MTRILFLLSWGSLPQGKGSQILLKQYGVNVQLESPQEGSPEQSSAVKFPEELEVTAGRLSQVKGQREEICRRIFLCKSPGAGTSLVNSENC